MSAPTAMRDLTAGIRVRHLAWETSGTVRVTGHLASVRWDGLITEDEISSEGPVFPGDVEILAGESGSA